MHPPLFRPHPDCQDIIKRFVACHDQNKISKYFGVCNDLKAELDECFRKEKDLKRDANLKKSKEFDEKYKQIFGESFENDN